MTERELVLATSSRAIATSSCRGCAACSPRRGLRRIATEEHPAFAAFRLEPWARERDHRLDAFDPSLTAFAHAREETIAYLRALPADAGERVGVSGLFGPMSLRQYATHVVDHDVEHLAQMARARATATHLDPFQQPADVFALW